MALGILLKILATLAFTLMGVCVRLVSDHIPVGEMVFFRSGVALILLVLWLAWRGGWPDELKTRRPLGHLGRGLSGAAGMFANFASLAVLPLADATAYFYASPIFVTLIAALALRENVHFSRWAAVAIGFGGVLTMLSEHVGFASLAHSLESQGFGATVALMGAFFAALSIIQTRRLAALEHTAAIVFYFTSLTTFAGGLVLVLAQLGAPTLAGQLFVWPDDRQWLALVGAGVAGGFAQIAVTTSYRYADASLLAAYDYFALVWALILSVLFFGDWPGLTVLAGVGAIAASGLLALFGEKFFNAAPKTQPQSAASGGKTSEPS